MSILLLLLLAAFFLVHRRREEEKALVAALALGKQTRYPVAGFPRERRTATDRRQHALWRSAERRQAGDRRRAA